MTMLPTTSRPANHTGFTLIEILVVTAVFSIVFLLGTTVFLNIQSQQRGVLARQKVVADGRYVLESIARNVRLSAVDYAFYTTTPPDSVVTTLENILVLRDQTNMQVCYRLKDNQMQNYTGVTACDPTVPVNDANWTNITPDDLQVQNFNVYIKPGSDPFMKTPTVSTDCRVARNPVGTGLPVIDGFDNTQGVCICNDTHGTPGDDIDPTNCWPDQSCRTIGSVDICQNATIQPRVTLVMRTKATSTAPGEQAEVTLQTTVGSRVYRR